MDFLQAILGDDLFGQVKTAIEAYNGKEENKDKQVNIANLGSGQYVSKLKYDDITSQLTGKQSELDKANGLIKELQKATKGDEDLQGKITAYEGQVADLQAELAETKLKSAIKVALLSANAADVDYLAYKLNESLKEKGETLELDENDNIKGWDARLETLKTTFPTMFNTGDGSNGEYKPLDGGNLPKPNPDITVTKEQFLKMGYEERVKFKESNEKLYKQYTGK